MNRRPLVLALVLLLASCGSDDPDESAPETAGPEITLSDFALEPASVEIAAAGTTTFRVVNDGATGHALEVDGEGIEEETDVLDPGESATLTVALEEGEYELYCPVGNHREQGMEGTLVVGSRGAATGTNDAGDEDEGGDYPYGP